MARPVTTEESDRRRAELDAQRAAANPALHALRADAKAIRAALLAGTLAATPDMEATILRTLETAERALLTAEGTALALGAALAGISRLPAPAAEPSINHHRRRTVDPLAIVDLTTVYWPEQARRGGYTTWTAPLPPPYVWGKLPEGAHYTPNRAAVEYALRRVAAMYDVRRAMALVA